MHFRNKNYMIVLFVSDNDNDNKYLKRKKVRFNRTFLHQ
jgi:hypothetical protein